MSDQKPHPPIVSPEEWLIHRKALLAKEKELTRQADLVAAERRRLPMVQVEKEYVFDGETGKRTLKELFDGQTQLLVYHFMFDPEWENGCPGCTSLIDAMGDLSDLGKRETKFVMISRAPLPKLLAYKAKKGWDREWYSSFDSDFNYDFNATHDKSRAPIMYNYADEEALHARRGPEEIKGEDHLMSVFFLLDGEVYHTYSTFARGVEGLTDTYALLDITPYGRQEDWEDSPEGWPQHPTYG